MLVALPRQATHLPVAPGSDTMSPLAIGSMILAEFCSVNVPLYSTSWIEAFTATAVVDCIFQGFDNIAT